MTDARHVLRTERLGLRRYVAEDVDALRPVFADPDAALFYPAMHETAALERWIAWNLKNYDEFGFGLWVLESLATGMFLGDAGITWQTVEGVRVLEVGWHVHPDHRRLGYATEAGRACLAYAFRTLRAEALGSIVDPRNLASIHVARHVHASVREYAGSQRPMLFFNTTAAQFEADAD